MKRRLQQLHDHIYAGWLTNSPRLVYTATRAHRWVRFSRWDDQPTCHNCGTDLETGYLKPCPKAER